TGEAQALIARASAFALTSDFEGMPNALVEAMVLGVPAVSTDCPTGPSELIEQGRNGWLVAPGDTEALTATLDNVGKNPAAAAAIAARGQETIYRMFAPERSRLALEG